MQKSSLVDYVNFFLNQCIKKYKWSLFFIAFASGYWAFDIQLRQRIFKIILESFETSARESALISVKWLMFTYFFFLLFRFLIFRLSSYVWLNFMPDMKIGIMESLMGSILLKSNILVKKDLDVLCNQIEEILNNCEKIVNKIFYDCVGHIIILISSLLIFYKNKFLFLSLVVLYVFFFFVSYIGYRRGVELNAKVVSFDMFLFSKFNDIFSNLFNVRLLNRYEDEQIRLKSMYEEYKKLSISRDFWYLIINGSLSTIFILYNSFCMFFLIWQYQLGEILKSDFIYFLNLNSSVAESLWYVVDDFISFSESIGKYKNTYEKVLSDMVDTVPKIENFYIPSHDICFENVSFCYPNSKKLLFEDISLNIKSGDKVGIIGCSGSGKSSLVSLLLNLSSLVKGNIKIGGVDITSISNNYLYSLITYMNQNLSLFNRSINENISYSRPSASKEEIVKAAKMANIHDFIQSLPNGYDTIVEYQGKEFSQGQKQRLLIARAFLKDTPILILDEITSSLDSKSENLVMDSLCKLMDNKTVLVIAHKTKTLLNMDYIITINKGKIIKIGTHEDLMSKKSVYEMTDF